MWNLAWMELVTLERLILKFTRDIKNFSRDDIFKFSMIHYFESQGYNSSEFCTYLCKQRWSLDAGWRFPKVLIASCEILKIMRGSEARSWDYCAYNGNNSQEANKSFSSSLGSPRRNRTRGFFFFWIHKARVETLLPLSKGGFNSWHIIMHGEIFLLSYYLFLLMISCFRIVERRCVLDSRVEGMRCIHSVVYYDLKFGKIWNLKFYRFCFS